MKSDWRGVFGSLSLLTLFIAAWALAYWVWFR